MTLQAAMGSHSAERTAASWFGKRKNCNIPRRRAANAMKYKWYTAYAEMNKRFSLSVAMRIEKAFFCTQFDKLC